MMSVMSKVPGLIEPTCNECIAEWQQLSTTSQADKKARELVESHGFERKQDACSLCGALRTVIRQCVG